MDLLRQIYDAGVVGAGGAGFPTHKKLSCKVEYFIINGVECEPFLMTDQYLMRNKGNEIVAAAALVGDSVGASHIVFALKKKYESEAQALREAIEKTNVKARLFLLDEVYPAGDEHVLAYEVTGRTVEPGGIPLSAGTVVSNISTVYYISEAVNNKPVTSRYLTVTGEVRKPRIIKAPIGMTVTECIEAAGGTDLKEYKVIMGGPMMGRILGKQQYKDRYITKTDGGIIVIPEDHYLAGRDTVSVERIINQAKSVCIQCSFCTDMCPRFLIGHRLRPHRIMRAIAMGEENNEVLEEALVCSECGICELYACPMGLSPRKVIIHIKDRLKSKGINLSNTSIDLSNSAMRSLRKVPQERLIGRIGMAKYVRKTDDTAIELHPEKVCIPLKQHIGVAAVPVVLKGEEVREGQLIASVGYSQTGANIHAGIDGKVEEISSTHIIIRSAESR